MKKRKNKSNVPRHKRLKRSSRLQAAKCWIPKYNGKSLVHGYSNHFAVDKLCAVKELTLLGYKIDDEYVEQLKQSLEVQRRLNQKRKESREEKLRGNICEDYWDMYWDLEEYLQEEDDDASGVNEDWCEDIPF